MIGDSWRPKSRRVTGSLQLVEGDGCKDSSVRAVNHCDAAVARAQTGVSVPLKPQLPNQLSKSGTLSASENGDGQRRVMRPLARPRLHNHASMVGPPRNLSVRSTEVQEPVPCTFSGGVRLEAGEKTERQNPDFRGTHFVDQNLHSSGSTTSDLARSRAAIAAERLTVGKSSRNSSSVWPPFS